MRVAPSAHVDDGLLSKVRALLAKAESTTFDAEADAFTAKAQELMTRHRIDRAHLEGDISQPPPIGGRRIGIDNPYPETKAMLLSVVAQANNGRAVWEKKGGWATVFADPVDLDVIDELFTSLLLQAAAALQREGPRRNAGTTKRFRRSFLAAYAERIGQRLFHAAQETIDEAEAIADAFPQTRSFSVSATDGEGWYKGVHHADQADLAAGLRLPGR